MGGGFVGVSEKKNQEETTTERKGSGGTKTSSSSSSSLSSLLATNAENARRKISELFLVESEGKRTDRREVETFDDDEEEEAFLERHCAECTDNAASSSSPSTGFNVEESLALAESSLRLVNAQLRFLKISLKRQQLEEAEADGKSKCCGRRRRRRRHHHRRTRTLVAHALGSTVLNIGRVLNNTSSDNSSSSRGNDNAASTFDEENENEDNIGDIESVSRSLAKEILIDAVATLKECDDEDRSCENGNIAGDGRKILEEKQWYAACVARAIKACATLTIWPEREMDALVTVLLRECAYYEYEGARIREEDDGGKTTNADVYNGVFTEDFDWCLPRSSAIALTARAETTTKEAIGPVELLKIEALAALGYIAKRNSSGMCSRWQIVFPREFSPTPKKKKSSSLLASQKTLEKLMVFERSALVRSAACFAIISLLDSSEAKKYLAMAEMKEDESVSGRRSAVGAQSSLSSRRASSGFSTVSMNVGENAVALCETISYAWTRLSEHDARRRFPGAPAPSKNTVVSADKWISWLSFLTEKVVDSLPFLRLPKRLVPQLVNSVKSALLVEYSSLPSSAVVTAFYKEAPIIRCLGLILSAKIGFESLEGYNTLSSLKPPSLKARKYTADEMSLFLRACEALWTKAGASITRDSLIDKEVQESCEAFKALQKLASSENASKVLFPDREFFCKLSPDVLKTNFLAKSSSRASKVACEKIMHASVKLQCSILAAVLQKIKKKNGSSGDFLFCEEIRRTLWCNFIDKGLPSCLSNARSDEVTQLVKIAALRCVSEATESVITDIQSGSNDSAEISRIKALFEAPLEILREKYRRYPSATRAEAMRTLASLLILDPKYFGMNEILFSALKCVKNAMNQERTNQDFSKTLEMNASLCAANIALCISRLPSPPPSADDSDDASIEKELTHLFHEWSISKGDKVRANVARGLGHIAKFRDLEDETLQLICEALFSCVSTGSSKTQWNSCVAIKILFENQDAISNEAFGGSIGSSNNAGVTLTRLLLTLIKTSENFKIRRESLAAISRVSRTFLNHFSYVDCIRVVVEALVQSEKQYSKIDGELEEDGGHVTSKRAAERYREELKAQAISTFVHLLSIGEASERGCSRILSEHSSHVLEAIQKAVSVVEARDGESEGNIGFESATKFDKETVSKAETMVREMLGVGVHASCTDKVLHAKNENVPSSKNAGNK